MKRCRLGLSAMATAAALAAGCNSSSVSPTETESETEVEMGVVTAAVHDSAAVLPANRTSPSPPDSTLYTGSFGGSVEVELYSSSGEWISLGEPRTVEFAVYCLEGALPYDDASVPVDTYSQVRLTLDDFAAVVDSGAVLQAVEYDTGFTVDLADGNAIVIEKSVTPFSVTADNGTKILFDLNSEIWLDGDVVTATNVSGTEVAAATVVYVE